MNDKKKRLFIAINLPNEIKEEINRIISKKLKRLGWPVRWIESENYHLTLKFLGYLSLEESQEITSVLKQVTQDQQSFNLTLSDFTLFPDPKRPRYICLGTENYKVLKDFANKIIKKVDQLSFIKPERRPFKPHLTMARFNKLFNSASEEKLEKIKFNKTFQVTSIDLMQSHLSSGGAQYEIVNKFNLSHAQG